MFSLTSKKLRVGIWACVALLAVGLFFSVRAVHDEGPAIGGGPNGQPNGQPLVAMGKTACVGGWLERSLATTSTWRLSFP